MSAGTTRRTVRVDNDLWQEAQAAASAAGGNLSDVLRDALRAYLKPAPPEDLAYARDELEMIICCYDWAADAADAVIEAGYRKPRTTSTEGVGS